MATFSPIITTSSPVTVVSSVPTITYQELLESIKGGGYQNKINGIYINASSFGQLTSNWTLKKPTQSGMLDIIPTGYLIDPAQKQPTAFLNLEQYDFVLDTLTSIIMQMQPYSSASLVIFSDAQQYEDAFDNKLYKRVTLDKVVEEKKELKTTNETVNKNNTVVKKTLVAVAGFGIVYLILSKI